jgi:Transporter associated domain
MNGVCGGSASVDCTSLCWCEYEAPHRLGALGRRRSQSFGDGYSPKSSQTSRRRESFSTNYLKSLALPRGPLNSCPFSNIPELNIRLHAGVWFAKRGLSEAPEKEFVTVGGLVLSELDHIPRPGEQLSHGGWRFEITEMDGARISKVLATPCPQRNKAANFHTENS